jgi:hypothetical protein
MHLSIPLAFLITTLTSVHAHFPPTLPRDLAITQPAPDLSQHQGFPGFEAQLITIAAAIAGSLSYPLVTALVLGFDGIGMANAFSVPIPRDIKPAEPALELEKRQEQCEFDGARVKRQGWAPQVCNSALSIFPSTQLITIAAAIAGGLGYPLATALILGFQGLGMVNAQNEDLVAHALASQELVERQAGFPWIMHSSSSSLTPSTQLAGMAAFLSGCLISPLITALILAFSGLAIVSAHDENEATHKLASQELAERQAPGTFWFSAAPSIAPSLKHAGIAAVVAGALASQSITALALIFSGTGKVTASPLPESHEANQHINIDLPRDLPVRNGVKSVFGFGARQAVDGTSAASPNFSLHIQLAALAAIVAGGLVSPYISALAVGFWVLGMARAQEVVMDYNPVSISQSRDVAARVTGRLISRLVTGAVLGFHGLGGVNAYPALADIGSVKENEKRDTVVVEGIDQRGLVGLDWPLLESI